MLAKELLFAGGTLWVLLTAASDSELTASAVRCNLALPIHPAKALPGAPFIQRPPRLSGCRRQDTPQTVPRLA